jgi:thiol-disulfide isomerase/thioredoxin
MLNRMRRRLAIVYLWLAVLLAGCPQPVTKPGLIGNPAPDFSAAMLNGEPFRLKDQIGQVVLLDFWATWCGPCLAELPMLLRIADEYKDQGVVLYTINGGEEPATIHSFLKKNGAEMNVVLDSTGEISDKYNVNGIPQLVLIDRSGNVKQIHVGYNPRMNGELRRELDQLVTAAKPAAL